MSPSIHSPPSPFSSPDTSSPAIYSPLLRSANVTIPTKPTRRPPPSPYSDTPSMDTIDTSRQIRGSIDSPMQLSYPPNTPLECGGHPDLNSPPLMRPPKPVRYNRKAPETRNSEDLSLDDDSSDDEVEVEEEEEEEEEDQDVQQASPTHSPPSIHSSCPSSQSTRSLSHTQYSLLRQNSNGLVAVIPEGCVDPSNLVEAERINGDQEDELDQKTYSPSDHLPTIPISPLKTTHRSLLEKEKSWTSMLADTKYRIQELYAQYPLQDDTSEAAEQKRCKDDREIMTLEDDACKYTSQISNIMATITKVRELLYRSAGITSILEFPPYLIAYQLTLIESAIFLEIPPAALLTHAPKTPHGSITASTDFFNYLTRMIEYSVLFPAEASGRAQIINHWVKVAVKLHELENFQTLKAVLCALGTPPIKRLKRTWGFLPRKSTSKIEMLSDLMSEDRNYGKYREMMNSLWAGTLLPSPEVSSPVLSDSVSGSRFDILGGWSSPEVKSKEAARRPVIPFLGTFIMDMTYLLAAVKKSNATSAAPSPSTKIPATSSLRERNLTVNTTFCPEDDVRIQDLLLTLTAYQSGPRYSPQPPRSYIKASTKTQHHFRAPSLSSALQMTTKYRNNNNAADRDRDRQFIFDDEDDDFLGGTGAVSGGIRSTQQLILHYILTRPWAPEKMVDELSMIREPNKNNSNNSSKGHGIGGGSWSNSAGSLSSWSGTGSMYSHSSTISTDAHTSMASSEGSRPTSMEDE
ncbi:ras guanine nucleotide exchange factor domain-containing protein [Gamsiella multidivaricata]|uniref:ras guanine nucleotide exchange factor domain-containing protein n=1 Tax=Gamsiella multidivaricata TaxID=101098 RepID=UPI00221F6C44|nr:ras guanine nucleotide exchange factor domain-containing protein [Gamsiella multidivaricata]KAI7819821.1 ras guanine nucleotide exchange factor domain-containing protein [Gamsiella multidivaricata]